MRRDNVCDFAAVVSRTALFFTCAMFFLLGYTPESEALLVGAGLFAGAEMLFYLYRRLAKHTGLFVLLHVVTAAAVWLVTPAVLRVSFAVGLLALLADSFYCRLRPGGRGEYGMHWAPAGLLVLLYIVGASYKMELFCTVCFYGTACFLAGWILYTGLSRTNLFLEDSKNMANVPAGKIRSQAGGILAVFSCAVLALWILAPKTALMQLLDQAVRGILFVVGKLLGMVHVSGPAELAEEPQTDMGSVFRGGLFAKEEAASPIWDILDNIVFIILYAAIFCAAVVLVFFVFKKLRALFKMQTEVENDITERIVPEMRQRLSFKRKNSGNHIKITGAPENVKIRKLYKKYMEARVGKSLTPSATPKELEEITSAHAEIRTVYEKARYSGKISSKEETEKMKQMTKR